MAAALKAVRPISCQALVLHPPHPLARHPCLSRQVIHPIRSRPHLKSVYGVGGCMTRHPQTPQQREFFSWLREKLGGSSGSDDGGGKGDKTGDGHAPSEVGKPSDTKAPAKEEEVVSAGDSIDGISGVGEKTQPSIASSNAPAGTGDLVPVSTAKLQKDAFDSTSPLICLPLQRRPLFPGQQQLLQISNPDVVRKVTEMLKHKNPVVTVFLRRDQESGEKQSSSLSQGAAASLIASHGRRRRKKLFPATEELVHINIDNSPDRIGDLETHDGQGDPLKALYHIGTRARIAQAGQFGVPNPGGAGPKLVQEGLSLLLFGHDLVKMEKVVDQGPPAMVEVSVLKPTKYVVDQDNPDELKANISEVKHTISEIMKVNPQFREHTAVIHKGVEKLEAGDPNANAHFAASLTTASGEQLMEVLEEQEPLAKLQKALVLLRKELELSTLQQKISQQIDEKVSGSEREFLLREQLKMLKKELGEEKDEAVAVSSKFSKRLQDKVVPKEAKEVIDAEMEKFSSLSKESQEFQVTRNYLDWLTMLPWGIYSQETLSLSKAKAVLDRDHHGLVDVKQRILELIAVGQLRGSVQGKIVCFVGPPGVGKTSIGRSIAEALGREFHRFSVGGLYDVAEIKGHRRTYVGAMPGKVVQCFKKVQTQNPLILIDEIDKLGRGHSGDPASALLELLDPSQNSGFLDHYLDIPMDCSKVLFVCTANVTHTIPGPLLDRMEVIRLSGYDQKEKLSIAEDYLVPTALRDAGLWAPIVTPESTVDSSETSTHENKTSTSSRGENEPLVAAAPDATIARGALESLIRWYCRESGVRNLQQHIEKISRKLAMRVVERREEEIVVEASQPASSSPEKDNSTQLMVTEGNLSDFVGKAVFTSDRLYENDTPPGTVMGLAWTSLGGTALYVEATALPRAEGAKATPSLNVTGQLGDVMKESARIALLVARHELQVRGATSDPLSLSNDSAINNSDMDTPESRPCFFESHELHLHCPEGATPKDGPSAGVTMVTSMLSLAFEKPVREDLAMTGEVTLNGKVLPVGGIKEKTIAARRAGCKTLVFPRANQRDFDELAEYLKEGLDVHYASEYSDVSRVVFPEM